MRLKEITNTSNNSVKLTTDITHIINKTKKSLIKDYDLPHEYKEFTHTLYSELDNNITNYIQDNYPIEFNFNKLDSGSGQFIYPTSIIITDKILINLTNLIGSTIIKDSNNIQMMLKSVITNFVKVFIHELTHYKQLSKSGQVDNRNSLLIKNKFKLFNELFNNMNKEIYYSQPDEIEAYANELVSSFLSSISNYDTEKRKKMLIGFLNKLKENKMSHPYQQMKHFKVVYNKFLKVVYKIIIMNIDLS